MIKHITQFNQKNPLFHPDLMFNIWKSMGTLTNCHYVWGPSRQDGYPSNTLNHCWINAGPTFSTLNQQKPNISLIFTVSTQSLASISRLISPSPCFLSSHCPHGNFHLRLLAMLVTSTVSRNHPAPKPLLSCSI